MAVNYSSDREGAVRVAQAITGRVVDINALRVLAPLPRTPVPRPSRPQPWTPPPAGARRHSIVEYVPEQARQLGFDGLGVSYIVPHEWGHEVQYQRVRDPVALLLGRQPGIFPQATELQADCLAGYFIGATFGTTVPNIEARLMARAATIGDDRILHDQRLAGPLGNFLDVFTPGPHGNGRNRAANELRLFAARSRGKWRC